jgi:tRNA dimethylallyltransferase
MGKRIELSDEFYRHISNTIIVITGPTASGKTAVSVELSKILDIEIISADSRQIYKYLDIGTAKPSREEQLAAKHHFIDILKPDEYYSAGLFGEQSEKRILHILKQKKLPVVVGGSGLYIKALFEGLFKEDTIDIDKRQKVRTELEERLSNDGLEKLYDELCRKDPISAKKFPDMNPRRVIRALEHYILTGQALSLSHKNAAKSAKFNPLYFSIHFERKELYDRINLRTELMWKSGLIEEVQNIIDMGYSVNSNSLNTVGYKEAIKYINGELTENVAIELIKKNTRNYAKRQLTWFRDMNIKQLKGSNIEMAESIAADYIQIVAKKAV